MVKFELLLNESERECFNRQREMHNLKKYHLQEVAGLKIETGFINYEIWSKNGKHLILASELNEKIEKELKNLI